MDRRRALLVSLLALLVVGLLAASITVLPSAVVSRSLSAREQRTLRPYDRLQSEASVRTALLQALAGVVLVIGAVAAWRQVQLSRQELRLTERGHVADRMGQTVEQLGHATADVRVGAIFALEQIAAASDRDRHAVLEILQAFIRARATRSEQALALSDLHRDSSANPSDEEPTPLRVRAPDLQAALTVLVRIPRKAADRPLVLDGVDLRGAHLADASLAGVWLQYVDFSFANLNGADLRKAHLSFARFHGTDLVRADLRGAALWCADLREAGLQVLVLPNQRRDSADADDSGNTEEHGLMLAARLDGAQADRSTRWPAGLDASAAGVQTAGEGTPMPSEEDDVVVYRFVGERPPA